MRTVVRVILAAALAFAANGCGQMPIAPKNEVPFTFLVTNPDGAAVEGVLVELSARNLYLYGQRASTGADGRASFQLMPGEYEAFLIAPGREGLPQYTDVPSLRIEKSGQQYHYAYGGIRISGTMKTPEGVLVDSGAVYVDSVDPNDHNYTDVFFHGGQFRLWVPAGTYRLSAQAYPPSPYPPVVIPSLAIDRDSTLALLSAGHKITGHVSGPDGTPLPNTYIIAKSDVVPGSIGTTDASGDYVQYLPSGTFRWQVVPGDPYLYILPRYYPIAPVSGPATFDFSLTGTSWSGTLRDAGTSAPLAGYVVLAKPAESDSRSAYSETDAAGAFHLELESGRDYDLLVGLKGQWAQATFRMPIAGADSTFDILFDPSSATTRSVTLGAPLRLLSSRLERDAVSAPLVTPRPRGARAAAE